MKRYSLVLLLLLSICSCHRQAKNLDTAPLSRNELYKKIIRDYDIEAYKWLSLCSDDTLRWISLFLADSVHYWRAYQNIGYSNFLSSEPMSDTLIAFYTMKWCAYGGIENDEIKCLIPLKCDLYNWLNDYTFEWQPSVHNKDLYASEYSNIDSIVSVINATLDTISYLKLRLLTNAVQLFPIALQMANELKYPPAIYDSYRCYVAIYGSEYAMDSIYIVEAEKYLDWGTQIGFLPCVWKKSIQLLTGTYIQQDTIQGKILFQQCVDNMNIIPFWKAKSHI